VGFFPAELLLGASRGSKFMLRCRQHPEKQGFPTQPVNTLNLLWKFDVADQSLSKPARAGFVCISSVGIRAEKRLLPAVYCSKKQVQ
jgi:hypothetical protein